MIDKLFNRFWDKVNLPFDTTDEDCWNWKGARDEKGRARISINGQNGHASHVAWRIRHGTFPVLQALHHCDNPSCVNPSHLFGGTHTDNVADMVRKGRHWNTVKTYCKHGHELAGDNLYIFPTGQRGCRICRNNAAYKYQGKLHKII